MRTKFYFGMAILALGLWFLLMPQRALATFSLTVQPNPYRGSDDLRFEKIDPSAEAATEVLKIDITSDTRYELTQTQLTPLINEALGVVIPDNNFLFYVREATAHGVLNFVGQDTSVSGMKTIYTSDSSGTSDSFELIYVVKTPLDVPAGLYRGRLSFILRPIGSTTQSQVTKIVNIVAQVGLGESTVEISTATGSKIIALNPNKENMNFFDVLVNVKGALGSQFRILQFLPEPLKSPSGDELSYEAVNFLVQNARQGIGPTQPVALSSRNDEVYKSGPRGESEAFVINYNLGDLSKYKAGRYKTNLKYFLEQSIPPQTKLIDTFGLEVEIEPVFDLALKTERGGGIIEFPDLKPRQPAKAYEVLIEINTNKGKQYQVNQNMLSGLVSKEGQVIPSQYFTLKTEGIDTKGTLKFGEKQEVKKGDSVLFISDKAGSPDKFKVIYGLKVPEDIKAGDYSASVSYSLSEI